MRCLRWSGRGRRHVRDGSVTLAGRHFRGSETSGLPPLDRGADSLWRWLPTPEHREAIERKGVSPLHRRSFQSIAYQQLAV
jgi:hypothetical protein